MSLKIANVTINTTDPQKLAQWWVEALGGTVTADFGEYVATSCGDVGLGFQRDTPSVRQRVHLDLSAENREDEVLRLEALGATRGADHMAPGSEWTVMTDPDGNVFCVSRAY